MEDRIFNLLEKMYIDLSSKIDNLGDDLNGKIDKLDHDLNGKIDKLDHDLNAKIDKLDIKIDREIASIKENMATKQDIVRLENKMDENHKALYDGYKQSIEGINELRDKFHKLADRVDQQEIKLQVIKGSR